MTWWKESSSWKWWQDDDAEAVPSSAAAGSWEGGTSSSATETWDWTDSGPNLAELGAWNEEAPRRGRGGRKGSAQTPGKGELLGYRWRFNPWTGKEFWSEKRAKVLPPGRTPHRSGAIPPSGNLVEMAKLANESGEITCFTRLLWPHYGGDYPRDDVIGERSVKEGIYELLRDPSKQWGSPLVYFQLKAAMHGVVLKLRSQGTRNLTNSLTMIGSASMIELVYHEFYHYTLSVFPLSINDMPIRPLIREATRGPRFGGKGVEEADDGAEVQAVVLRENVSLVPPDEPEEPTPVEGEEEVEQFVAFGPIEDFQPDWGDEPQTSSETEQVPQVVPDSFDIPPEWGPSVELAQRVCSQLNLVGVIKQIALASSPVWKPEDPIIRFYTTCFKNNSNWKRGYTTFF